MNIVKRDGDSYLLDNGSGDKVYRIPVEWKVYDTVKVRANSLEDAVRLFLDNEGDIPLGKAPEYADESYCIATYAKDNAEIIAKELRTDYDSSIETEWESN